MSSEFVEDPDFVQFSEVEDMQEADTGEVFLTKSIDNPVDTNERSGWFGRHKLKLALGAAATSLAFTLINDPFEETKSQVLDAAPWVAGGIAASEGAFVVGAGMMLAAVGEKVGNPLTIKRRTKDIAEKAKDSKLFMSGFVLNTAGAVGDFAVLSVGVMKELPPTSWGVLSLTLMDLSLTVAIRKGILNSIESDSEPTNQ